MPVLKSLRRSGIRTARIALLGACAMLPACGRPAPAAPETAVGLYTSLPITWGESEDLAGFLDAKRPPHWALPVLRSAGTLVPLDTLADPAGKLPLPAGAVLVLAQPRPLSPTENVALDTWVRGGGRVLLLVDPMLTAATIFAPGDPRRPQDIAMLSPILARWGLVLQFDAAQPAGERMARLPEGDLPVNQAGRFRLLGKTGDMAATCRLEAQGLLADCHAGQGRILAVADAAVLELRDSPGDTATRATILEKLLARLRSQP